MRQLLALLILSFSFTANAARLKDIADVEGVRGNQLIGFGVVVGLQGTGDGMIDFTLKGVSNLLENMGMRIPANPQMLRLKDSAGVMVTAELPPFIRPGSRIDVSVSAVGDAKSLQGGNLLFSPLKGADGNVYAVGQGMINLGGFAVSQGGDSTVKNHPTVGFIPQGAIVERAIPFDLFQSQKIRIVLRSPDFTTMTRIVAAINARLGRAAATALDSASVQVGLGGEYSRDPVMLMSLLEQIEVEQDVGARVIVNERTGTIVMGEHVTISKVALAHGNLNVTVRSETQVSQPNALAQGTTEAVTNSDVTVGEEVKSLQLVEDRVTLGEVVKGLNALGATPRDLISIFSALRKAGALHADLIIM